VYALSYQNQQPERKSVDLIERDFILPPVVQLRRPGRRGSKSVIVTLKKAESNAALQT
jgi:hypothetical protein